MRILNDKLEAAFHRDSKSVSEVTQILGRLHSRESFNNFKMKLAALSLNYLTY